MLQYATQRRAKTAGDRTEDEVLALLEKKLPHHWVIIGLVPSKPISKNGRRGSTKEIDAIIIADKTIFVIEIKSHSGRIRIRDGKPFQKNGVDIKDRTNLPSGFWWAFEQACYKVKDLLEERFGVERSSLVPKMIWEGADSLEYGESEKERDVTDTLTFANLALSREKGRGGVQLDHALVQRIARYLTDEEGLIVPPRAAATAPRPSPNVPSFQSPPSAPARPRTSPAPPTSPVAPHAETATYSAARSFSRAPAPPPTPSAPVGAIIGWLIAGAIVLSILSELRSCSGRVGSAPSAATSTPASGGFAVQYYSSPQTYLVASSADVLRVNVRSGPGGDYPQVTQLAVGDRVIGNGSAIGTDGATWITVTLPSGGSGFIAERLLRPANAEAQLSEHPSFSCAGELNWVERTICSNADLAAKDREVAGLYRQIVRLPGGSDARDTQRGWLEERDRCGGSGDIPACLQSVYDSRLATLRNWLSASIPVENEAPMTPSVSSVPDPIEVRRPSRGGAYQQGSDAQSVACILPSGQEVHVSYQACRQQAGVIYR